MPGRMHATGFFRGYRLLLTTTFAWRSLTRGTIFHLVFMSKSDSLLFGTPLHPAYAISQAKSVCVIEHKRVCNRASVCVLLLVPILLA